MVTQTLCVCVCVYVYDIFKSVMSLFQIANVKLIRFRVRMYWNICEDIKNQVSRQLELELEDWG